MKRQPILRQPSRQLKARMVAIAALASALSACLGPSLQLADPPTLQASPRPPEAPEPDVSVVPGKDPNRTAVSKSEPAPLGIGAQVALIEVAATCAAPVAAAARWVVLATAIDKGLRIADLTNAHGLAVVRAVQAGGESTEWRGTLGQTVGLGRVTPGSAVLSVDVRCGETTVIGEKRTYAYPAVALSKYEAEVAAHRAAVQEHIAAVDKASAAWNAEYRRAVQERDAARNGWNRFWAAAAEFFDLPQSDGGYASGSKEFRDKRQQLELASKGVPTAKSLAEAAAKRIDTAPQGKPSVHLQARVTDTKGGHLLALVLVDRVADSMDAALATAIGDMFGAVTPAAKKGGR
jgi:hypothetical protein